MQAWKRLACNLQCSPSLPNAQPHQVFHIAILPLHPVLKYGVNIALVKVIVLLESYLLRQMLPLNVFALGPLQFSLGDSPISAADSSL
jgi:hypothetical protein